MVKPFFNNKSKTCGWSDSKFSFMLFYISSTKNTGFNLNSWWRPLLLTSQGSSSTTTHKIYLIEKDQRLSTEDKRVSKYRNVSKNSGERFHQHSPPWYYGAGINLRARLRLNKYRLSMILGSNISLAVNINLYRN